MARMHRRVLVSAVVASVTPFIACSLRSLSYLGDGSPDASVAPDSSLADQGAPDAEGGAGQGTWCQRRSSPAAFCMDFDEGDLAKAYRGGTLAFVDPPVSHSGVTVSLGTPASSDPAAVVVAVDAVSAGKVVAGEYQQPHTIATSARSLELSFDLLMAAYTSAQSIDFATIALPNPDGGAAYRTYLSFENGSGVISTDTGTNAKFPFPADGGWHNYRLDLALQPSLSLKIYVDDPDAGGPPATQLGEVAPFATVSNATFYVGVDVSGASAPVRANLDNVTFDGH